MLDKVATHLPEIHWARSATVPLLRHDPSGRALFLGDAAQAMVPTLGQGATQAVECGVVAGMVLRRGGDVRQIAALRDPRVAFVRDFSLEASDTLVSGADVVAGTRAKASPEFLAKLRRIYTDIA
jgi:salicylate hydroxylase